MAIKIGNYQADGPYTDLGSLRLRSGVYIMLGRSSPSEPWKVVDVRQAIVLRHRIAYHLRAGDYDGHGMLAVAVIDADSQSRKPIESDLRRLYNLPRTQILVANS